MGKFESMSRFIPDFYRPETNVNVRALLQAWAEEDDNIVSAIQDAKDQIFVMTAELEYLDSLGSNVGVFRPTAFNLADSLYRKLIPALSYHPKQIKPTILEVLRIFFGEDNDIVKVFEVNPNEIVIQIPGAVPALRRTLRGSHHFHSYSGTITTIDNNLKQMIIALSEETKILAQSELTKGWISQNLNTLKIKDNSEGNSGVILQFEATDDLSIFNTTDNFIFTTENYLGSYIKDPDKKYSITSKRGVLGQDIIEGQIIPTLTMEDASSLPSDEGYLIINAWRENEESMVRYIGRPNNTTLLLDPIYSFKSSHAQGEPVNLIQVPQKDVSKDGSDYAIYIVGVTAARILAQDIIKSIIASGVVVRWIVREAKC